MKKFLALIFAVLCVIPLIASCGTTSPTSLSPSKSFENENEFYEVVSETQELLDIVADDIYTYWYECIYNDKYLENINYAIACAKLDNKENIDKIETNNEKIKDLYSKIRDGELKAEVKAVMQAYNDYYALVIEVSGSFNSYSANKETCKKELSSTLKDLSFEL